MSATQKQMSFLKVKLQCLIELNVKAAFLPRGCFFILNQKVRDIIMKKSFIKKKSLYNLKQNIKPYMKCCPVKRAAFHRIGNRKQ